MHQTGLVVGKFLPPHHGHLSLIEFGRNNCETLHCWVVDSFELYAPLSAYENQMPAATRMKWLKELYPDVVFSVVPNIPGHDDVSKDWAKYTHAILGRSPDVVFTSEEYGKTWAKELGCAHMLHDPDRVKHTISGTDLRDDPFKNWDYLPARARAYLSRKVTILGGESTGKTTMAKQLADHYQTVWVPEYGRKYCEDFGVDETDPVIWSAIYHWQPRWEKAAALAANKVYFCDTDLATTAIWYRHWTKKSFSDIEYMLTNDHSNDADLVLLLDHDVPWVQDGMRSEGDEEVRKWFTKELGKQHFKPHLISGSYDERFNQAVELVEDMLSW